MRPMRSTGFTFIKYWCYKSFTIFVSENMMQNEHKFASFVAIIRHGKPVLIIHILSWKHPYFV